MASLIVFVFGLAIGSFLSAFVYRLEKGESALRGRSYCPRCKHSLAWYDLIPLVSFLFLKGRCRYCKGSISWQDPLVELATGILFVALLYLIGSNLTELSLVWAIGTILIAVFVYDLKHSLIPDMLVYLGVGLAILWRIVEFLDFDILNLFRISDLGFGISAPLVQSLLAGISASVFFFAIFLVSRGVAMGFGDVKFAFLLGLFLGWPSILVALFFAFSIGAVCGIALIAFKKKGLRSEVPFAPFLIMGSAVAFFFGESILHWYLDLLLV